MPTERSSQLAVGTRPRLFMSSVKEERRESGCSTRPPVRETKVPEPWRWRSTPSATRPWIALRTVTREMPSEAAMSRSGGRAALVGRRPSRIASRISVCRRT